jgi:hypothetical protein
MIEIGRKRRLSGISEGWAAFETRGVQVRSLAGLKQRLAHVKCATVDEVLNEARFLGHDPGVDWNSASGLDSSFWFRDPVSGKSWPGADFSAFKIDVRSTSATPSASRPYGDVKFVWEPNRLQILQPLSVIIAGDGPDAMRARDTGLSIISSWMEANPPYRGVNWISGIELSLRLVSITMFAAAIESQPLGDDGWKSLARFVEAHARMLDELPSLYSSANNHRVAEGLGLFLAGESLPGHSRAAHWRNEGREILQSEALLQIFSDGVGREQSPTYQAFTMELIAFGALVAADSGQSFSNDVIGRLAAGARFLADLHDAGGSIPGIGDDDEGRVLYAPHVEEPSYVASVIASLEPLCGSISNSPHAPGYLREALFGVETSSAGVSRSECFNVYEEGGYSVIHREIGGRWVDLVFDHGPLGYLALAAHGHADALSIWMSVDGKPVFIDPGTWLYHSGEARRATLRSSCSHNTLSLRGISQSEPSAAFSWSSKANATGGRGNYVEGSWSMRGEQDGYKGRRGIVHRRELQGRNNGFTITDRLIGTGQFEDVEISFLCSANVSPRITEEGKVHVASRSAGTSILTLAPPETFRVSIEQAAFSEGFGKLGHTARILLFGRMQGDPAETVIEFDTIHA